MMLNLSLVLISVLLSAHCQAIKWPLGKWGLPKTVSGCPMNDGFTWHEGIRGHDNEDKNNANDWSDPNHFPHTGGNIEQHFCIKTSGGSGYWPAGDYCIYMRNSDCPNGFTSGFIYWDDEDHNNINSYSGYLPEGSYDRNTKIWYCCRDDGSAYDEIALPTDKPFYLFRHHDICQQVSNTRVTMEWLHFDNEDHNNRDATGGDHPYEDGGDRNHRLNYCYYESVHDP